MHWVRPPGLAVRTPMTVIAVGSSILDQADIATNDALRRRSTRCHPTDPPTILFAEGRSMTGRVAVIGGGTSAPPLPGRSCSNSPMPMSRSSKKRTASLRTRPVATAGSSTPASTTSPVRPKPCCAAGVSASSRRSRGQERGIRRIACGKVLSRSTTSSVGGWTHRSPGAGERGTASVSSVPRSQRARAACTWCRRPTLPIYLDRQFHRGDMALVADAVAARRSTGTRW